MVSNSYDHVSKILQIPFHVNPFMSSSSYDNVSNLFNRLHNSNAAPPSQLFVVPFSSYNNNKTPPFDSLKFNNL